MLKGLKIKGAGSAPPASKRIAASSSSVMKAPVFLERDSWMTGAGSSLKIVEPVAKLPVKEIEKKVVDLAHCEVVDSTRVGDGGLSWRRRMQRRANERREAEADGLKLPERAPTAQERNISRDNERSKEFIQGQRSSSNRSRNDKNPDETRQQRAGSSRSAHEEEPVSTKKANSAADLNQMAARALRLKLANDIAGYDRLQAEIATIRAAPRIQVLPDIDAQGRPTNLSDREDSISALVQQERLQTRSEYTLNSAMTIVRDKKYSTSTDDQFDAADVSNFDQRKRKATDDHDRDLKKLVNEHHRAKRENSNCWFCLDGDRVQRHLIVSIGSTCYLQMVAGPPLGLGHCLIVPSDHAVSSTAIDEQVYEEMTLAKQQLVRMFEQFGLKCIFLESCSQKGRHAFIECIPLDHEAYADAPIYFKKAIMESDEEWSSHKKLMETGPGRSIRSVIPSGFPFFHVQFGDDMTGYAHVIEDERKFKGNFGKEIICGLLDEPAEILLRAKPEPRNLQLERVSQFRTMWTAFDWTKHSS